MNHPKIEEMQIIENKDEKKGSPLKQWNIPHLPFKQNVNVANNTKTQNMMSSERLTRRIQKIETEEYKPFQVPPDFQFARKHGLAKKIGKISRYSKCLKQGECCVCCNLPFQKTPFLLKESIEKFASLGSAFTLFFECNKQMIGLLTSCFVIGGMRNLFEICLLCWGQDCSSFLGIIYSQNNNNNNSICSSEAYLRNMLNFTAFWVLFFGVIISKIRQDSKNFLLQKNSASHCDFTILVSGVEDTNCEEELKEFLSTQLIPGQRLQIVQVNRAFKIQTYFELASERIILINELQSLKDQQVELRNSQQIRRAIRFLEKIQPLIGGRDEKKYQEQKKKLKGQLEINSKALRILEEKYADNDSEGIRTELVFVTFEKQLDCMNVKDQYIGQSFNESKILFHNKMLTFLPAFEPLDIIWQNLEIPDSIKMFRRSLFVFLAALLTLSSLLAVSLVTKWQKEIVDQVNQQHSKKDIRNDILSFLCIIIITAINSILSITMNAFTEFEKHNTFTSSTISLSEKLSWIQFINTALVPFVILLVLTPEEQQSQATKNEYLQYVLQDIFFIFIGNVVFAPIFVLLNPSFYFKKVQRWWYERQELQCTKTQQQLNQIYEDPEFPIQEYYAILNRIVLCSFFYATMLSLGILLNCIAMIALYWTFKYAFIRRSAYPKCLSSHLHERMQGILLFTPLIYTIGNLTYGKVFLGCTFSNLFNAYNIIEILVGSSLLIFRKKLLEKLSRYYLKTRFSKSYQSSYSFEKKFMGLSYVQANPITRAFDPSGNKMMGLIPSETLHRSLSDSVLKFGQRESESQSDFEEPSDPRKNPAFAQRFKAAIQAKQINSSKDQEDSHKNEFNRVEQSQTGEQKEYPDISEDMTKSIRIKDIALVKQPSLRQNNDPEADSIIQHTRRSIQKNTKSSIMEYAFTNVLLSRERHNLVISAAFERKPKEMQEISDFNENDDPSDYDGDFDANREKDRKKEANFTLSQHSQLPQGQQYQEMADLSK